MEEENFFRENTSAVSRSRLCLLLTADPQQSIHETADDVFENLCALFVAPSEPIIDIAFTPSFSSMNL